MTEFRLAVHGSPSDPTLDEGQIQQAYASVDAFNEQLKASGAWVFAGGLHPEKEGSLACGEPCRAARVRRRVSGRCRLGPDPRARGREPGPEGRAPGR